MIAKLEAHRRPPLKSPLPSPSERKRIRTDYGVTAQAVADVLGVSRMSVSAWEKGTYDPTGENATKYAELLREMREALNQEETPDDQD